MRKGFTLIEISIVLVIIGLLIGGVLIAQSLMGGAKAQNMVSKLRQYEIAVTNFKTTFRSEPGDAQGFVPFGNNDGYVNSQGSCVNADGSGGGTYSDSEGAQVCAHLSQAKMIKGDYVGYQPTTACGGTHNDLVYNENGIVAPVFTEDPAFASGGVTTSKISAYYSSTAGDVSTYGNLYIGRLFMSFAQAVDTKSLDAKLDDGVCNTGALLTSCPSTGVVLFFWNPDGKTGYYPP